MIPFYVAIGLSLLKIWWILCRLAFKSMCFSRS